MNETLRERIAAELIEEEYLGAFHGHDKVLAEDAAQALRFADRILGLLAADAAPDGSPQWLSGELVGTLESIVEHLANDRHDTAKRVAEFLLSRARGIGVAAPSGGPECDPADEEG